MSCVRKVVFSWAFRKRSLGLSFSDMWLKTQFADYSFHQLVGMSKFDRIFGVQDVCIELRSSLVLFMIDFCERISWHISVRTLEWQVLVTSSGP
jgi:hypothetical protein